jgi:RNA polymerase sigma-70 factor (ECF subfamily)
MGANSMTKAGDGMPLSRAAESEPELLRRIASSDMGAVEVLYDSYGSLAYGVALRITFDEALAQDVVQDAFISVWRHAARFDPSRGSVKTWLLAIVHHRAIDEVRRRRDLQALPEIEDDLPAPLTMGDVWSEVAERLDARSVRQAFAELPEPQQEALRLAYYEGLTQEEIASRTGTPLGTVKSRTRLGLLSLRRRLGDGDGYGYGYGHGQSEGRSGAGHDASGSPAQAVE